MQQKLSDEEMMAAELSPPQASSAPIQSSYMDVDDAPLVEEVGTTHPKPKRVTSASMDVDQSHTADTNDSQTKSLPVLPQYAVHLTLLSAIARSNHFYCLGSSTNLHQLLP